MTSENEGCPVTQRSTTSAKSWSARPARLRAASVTTLKFTALLLLTATAAQAEPLTFRGIPLGATLAEFRKMPFPDEAKYPKSRPICTGDREAQRLLEIERPPLSKDLARVGVSTCAYYSFMGGRLFRNGPDLANVGGFETTFLFTPAGSRQAAEPRLYAIQVEPRSDRFDTIAEALTVKFGVPADLSHGAARNRLGAVLPNETRTWRGPGFTITAARYGSNLNLSAITYRLDPLADTVTSDLADLSRRNAENL